MNDIAANAPIPISDLAFGSTADPCDDEGIAVIAQSGLFDACWYLKQNADIAAARLDPLTHFLHQGWQEGRKPNPYFDPEFYLARNPEVARAAINPLLHYILAGEAEGRAPGPLFDPVWYAAQYAVPAGTRLLRHFLERRMSGSVSPLPEFDPAYYLNTYPDIASAKVDPFDHYLRFGYREGRDPQAGFDTKFYISRYLGGELEQNPLLHWRQWRHALTLYTRPPEHEQSVFEQVRFNTRPGPLAERAQKLPRGATRRAKVLAYYLPQFHQVAENDAWWGSGFTEWTAISRGMPRYDGHYQPRIPGELGHYSLADAETMRRQIELARDAGVFGFVPYFYWFNGRRLLERPLEAFLADRSLDFPFALMWANENWTRRWDGSDQEVLISQDYRAADDAALLDCFARHFADPRYIRIGGRPLLMLYRPGLIPDCANTIARWRRLFRQRHRENPILVMSQSFGAVEPESFGMDGAIEFPPHKLVQDIGQCRETLRGLDPLASFQVYDYDDVVKASLAEKPPAFPLIKTAVPGWDNDARREGRGMVLHGATPAKYQAWLEALVDRSAAHSFFGERFVCVNAWNEWAEGAYLEPDVHYGAAFLNATARAVARLPGTGQAERVLLVGHDAFAAGAQMLLLHLGRRFAGTHGVAVEFLLLGEGDLLAEYSATAPTTVAGERKAIAGVLEQARARGITHALVNTTAAARVIPQLHDAGLECVLLVHEMPRLIAQQRLEAGARAGAALASRVIFPAPCVRAAFAGVATVPQARARVMPQGIYRDIRFSLDERQGIRDRLGLSDGEQLVLGCGYADIRKGFDLFLHASRAMLRKAAGVHFCWIGDIDEELERHLAPEIAAGLASGRLHLPGRQTDVGAWLSGADAFALTSREDPFPSVALEAMASGLGVAAFAGSGGIAELLVGEASCAVVAMSDAEQLAEALLGIVAEGDLAARAVRAAAAAKRYDFAVYAANILGQLRPGLPRISVAIPSHNYARYLPDRLASVFSQTHPVEEVLLLDDASTDDSVAVAEATAADWKRCVKIVANPRNGGSVFAQWQRAAQLAQAPYLWIAEADDSADPQLLSRLSRLLAAHPDIDLAFCDSRAVDGDGAAVMESYKTYYQSNGAGALLQDGLFGAADFARTCLAERNLILNASAVVFRTRALRDSLKRLKATLPQWRVAGDWRIYVDILAHSSGRVAYLAAPLNVHRRHAASVTATTTDTAMLAEIEAMHQAINLLLPRDAARIERQDSYRQSLTMVS